MAAVGACAKGKKGKTGSLSNNGLKQFRVSQQLSIVLDKTVCLSLSAQQLVRERGQREGKGCRTVLLPLWVWPGETDHSL